MRYCEIQPKPPLARFVECFWTLESNEDTPPVQPERILPDGCVELILNFAAPFVEHKENGQERQPQHFLVGQMTRPMLIVPTGPVQLMGVRFQPGGTFPFFRHPMHEVTDRVVQLEGLGCDLERDLAVRAGDAALLTERIAVVEKWLIGRLSDSRHDSWLMDLAAEIVIRSGQVNMDRLACDAGISVRQLERRYLQDVGIGPKLLCRILRFQQVFRAVEQNHEGWAAVAVDCGYYDQAHLIRDFQQFAHQPPSLLFAHPSPLTENFTRKNRRSHFSNTAT